MDDENESKNAKDIQRLLGNGSNVDQTWIKRGSMMFIAKSDESCEHIRHPWMQ
jgi:hypothetical protein